MAMTFPGQNENYFVLSHLFTVHYCTSLSTCCDPLLNIVINQLLTKWALQLSPDKLLKFLLWSIVEKMGDLSSYCYIYLNSLHFLYKNMYYQLDLIHIQLHPLWWRLVHMACLYQMSKMNAHHLHGNHRNFSPILQNQIIQ